MSRNRCNNYIFRISSPLAFERCAINELKLDVEGARFSKWSLKKVMLHYYALGIINHNITEHLNCYVTSPLAKPQKCWTDRGQSSS